MTRGGHQAAVTVYVRIRDGELEALRETLAQIADDVAGNALIPFGTFRQLHFARFVILDEAVPDEEQARDLEVGIIPAHLVFLSAIDAPVEDYLQELASVAGEGLDAVFQHCEAYPEPRLRNAESRRGYLYAHTIDEAAFYINTLGRTVKQVRAEAQLREALDNFLDRRDWSGQSAPEVRRALIEYAASRPELAFALQPASQPPLWWRAKEKLHLVVVGALGLILGLLLLPVILVGVLILRRKEKSDKVERIRPSTERLNELRSFEDYLAHNQFSAVGYVKAGPVRRIALQTILAVVNFGVRHIFNKGDLTGVKTIHFARWVFLDDKRRMLFASNYDGSLESYMVDFIDLVWWGLNIVFTNGYGYPRTRWLIFGGARDEQAFKNYIRNHQLHSQVWYSAYPQLTAVNIANNAAIRAGLSGAMSERDAARWLQRF